MERKRRKRRKDDKRDERVETERTVIESVNRKGGEGKAKGSIGIGRQEELID